MGVFVFFFFLGSVSICGGGGGYFVLSYLSSVILSENVTLLNAFE